MAHPSIGRANQGNGFPAVNLPNAASKLARAVSSVVDGCLPPLTKRAKMRNEATKFARAEMTHAGVLRHTIQQDSNPKCLR